MTPAVRRWKWLRTCAALFALLLGGTALAYQSCPEASLPTPTTIDELQALSACQLEALYRRCEMGRTPVGIGCGRLLCVSDERMPKVKVALSNAFWRGKGFCENGYFVNRWIGGVEWIDSRFGVGPSWVDGRPAVVIEYAPGTKLFGNTRDELREVSPGLYFGPLYETCPCPKLRGWLAVKVDPCKQQKRCCPRGH